MSRTVTLGSYFQTNSVLHVLDPRTKLVLAALYVVSVFVAPAPLGYIPAVAFLALALGLSRVPLKVVARAFRPLWVFLLLTAVLSLFTLFPDAPAVFALGPLAVHEGAMVEVALLVVKLGCVMLACVLLALVTSPVSIMDGSEWLLKPLQRLGVPVNEFVMMVSIAIRFVPILFEEANHIMEAQAARGSGFEDGRFLGRLRSLVPVLVPLFDSALRHAQDLADAMEARAYQGGEGRTHFHALKLHQADFAAFGAFALYSACLVATACL